MTRKSKPSPEPIYIVPAVPPMPAGPDEAVFDDNPTLTLMADKTIHAALQRHNHKNAVVFAHIVEAEAMRNPLDTAFPLSNRHGSRNKPFALPEAKIQGTPEPPREFRQIQQVVLSRPTCSTCEFSDECAGFFTRYQQCPPDKTMYFAELWLRRPYAEGCTLILRGKFIMADTTTGDEDAKANRFRRAKHTTDPVPQRSAELAERHNKKVRRD